jgi:glycosyltransferase involved in cell wall biosynthesis
MKITIGIVTFNREASFKRLMKSIASAMKYVETESNEYELIVIDNGDHTYAQSVLSGSKINVKLLEGQGTASKARNQIINNASGEYIAFIDDDCRLQTNYFNVLNKILTEIDSNMSIVGVAGEIIRTTNTNNPIDKAYLLSGMDHYFTHGSNNSLVIRFKKLRWTPTANLVVRRELAKSILFPHLKGIVCGGEDVIWGTRITSNCKHFICAPELAVLHDSLSEKSIEILNKLLSKAFLYGKSESYLTSYFNSKFTSRLSIASILKSLCLSLTWRLLLRNEISNIEYTASLIKAHFILGNVFHSIQHFRSPKSISLTKVSQDF